MSQPTIGHLDPAFVEFMDELKQLLRMAFQTQNPITLPISAPGSAGMECCFVNLLEPGDKVVIAVNGVFGGRMVDVATRCGATAIPVEFDWGAPVDPNKMEDALTLCALARNHDCLNIVDAVTSLGGIELRVDDWGIDAIYSGSQKCLSAPPGLSPVSFNDRAMEKLSKRKAPPQSWFLDLNLLTGYWSGGGKRAYHHTAPINSLYALHAALQILEREGIESAWQRHSENHELLRTELEQVGLEFIVAPEYRLPQLNSVRIPEGIDDAEVRSHLLNEFNLEIGAGLGPLAGKIWRIGLMGASCTPDHVNLCVKALKSAGVGYSARKIAS
jgi:alanine-glyoxylate transaminase/serine-glyoxylate transaminase/serine-pyruvate transaminase